MKQAVNHAEHIYTDKRQFVEVRLTPEERRQMKGLAGSKGLTVRELTSLAIRQYLVKHIDKHVKQR